MNENELQLLEHFLNVTRDHMRKCLTTGTGEIEFEPLQRQEALLERMIFRERVRMVGEEA